MLDYAGIMGRAQTLVPDLRQQAMQDQRMQMQREAFDMRREEFGYNRQQQAQGQAREAEFGAALDEAMTANDPDAIQRLMAKFPELAASAKPVWESMDENRRAADLSQMGAIYTRAQSGDFTGAADALSRRIEADRAAGEDVSEDMEILEALRGDDPQKQRMAAGMVGFQIAALNPEKFAETFGKLNPSDKISPKMREYNDRVAQFGQEAADAWLAVQDTELMAVEAGGSIYDKADFVPGASAPTTQRGGDPNGSRAENSAPSNDGGEVIGSLFPNARITQTKRDPNSALGRANPRSWHTRSNAAVDLEPIPGMSFQQFIGTIRDQGYPIIESRDEVKNPSGHATGPHWHVVIGERGAAPTKVKSKQQYDKLASGAEYIAPDGSRRRKP